jgi:hypothetical protein
MSAGQSVASGGADRPRVAGSFPGTAVDRHVAGDLDRRVGDPLRSWDEPAAILARRWSGPTGIVRCVSLVRLAALEQRAAVTQATSKSSRPNVSDISSLSGTPKPGAPPTNARET